MKRKIREQLVGEEKGTERKKRKEGERDIR